MNGNVDKAILKQISRRRMLQVSAAATATMLMPGIALADDWIKVNAVPLTNALLRVQTAVYLITTSSQYQVER